MLDKVGLQRKKGVMKNSGVKAWLGKTKLQLPIMSIKSKQSHAIQMTQTKSKSVPTKPIKF